MSVNDLIRTQKKLRTVLLICALIMTGLAGYFWYNEATTDNSNKSWIIVCMIMAAIGALTCIKLTLNINKEEKGIASVQRIIDSCLSYLRTVTEDGDARLYTGLILTLMDHYMTLEDNFEIERIAATTSLEAAGGSSELTLCGEKIVKTMMDRFENPKSGEVSKFFKLNDNERELYTKMSRRVLGPESIDNRIEK